ncbi:MAG: HAD family hydrolase [Anaerolinea sp.]|nr:HAD family hydrolase [Anaerolinea sp.]
MDRITAFAIVTKYVKNHGLINHMLSVEAVMRYYAEYLGEDVDLWGVTGLLHDFDWEIHPSAELHPAAGSEILRAEGVDEVIIHAILSHGTHLGIPRVTQMEKYLNACDEITGLVTAVALVRPSKSIYDLASSSVKKKWKDKAFAAGTNREEMETAAVECGLELWQHVDNVIMAMRRIAPELGLEGSLQPSNVNS